MNLGEGRRLLPCVSIFEAVETLRENAPAKPKVTRECVIQKEATVYRVTRNSGRQLEPNINLRKEALLPID
jgi:hypothetical protein